MGERHQMLQVKRQEAELALARELHGLILHEVGNPLQSLGVLVELTHEDLCEPEPDPARCADRLAKALVSLERLGSTLRALGRLRAGIDDLDGTRLPTWGSFLDRTTPLIETQLARLRASLWRGTPTLDPQPLAPGPIRSALVAVMLGMCEQVRGQRVRGLVLRIEPAEGPEVGLRLSLREAGEELAVPSDLLEKGTALIGERCRLDGRALVIWA